MQLGRLGVSTLTDGLNAGDAAAFAKRLEQWGYSALWVHEAFGRNVLAHASWLLANTRSLIVATGIANIYGRDATAMASAQMALNEQSGGRFLLGIGVSHPPLVQDLRGHAYDRRPVARMRDYIEGMKRLTYAAPMPAERPRMVLAALGPEMAKLGAKLADGGSDGFIDAMIAWGDEAAIRRRIERHWAAGADHVCIEPLHPSGFLGQSDETILERLAPARPAPQTA